MAEAQNYTKKHRQFVSEPMGGKKVTDLPGIGPVSGERLQVAGFGKANKVLGQFLLLGKNQDAFVNWLKEITDASDDCATQCFDSLKDWSDAFL